MRTVYLGTTEFAAVVLRALVASDHEVALVVSRPDARAGRGRRPTPPPVAVAARELGLDVIQPERLHDADVLERIAAARPDVLTTCAYGVLIKEPLLSDYEMFNVHPSLLPRWRGAAPLERAIMAGDAETGVSIMRVTAGWDSGPVYLQATEPIHPGDDYASLAARLQTLGGELLVRALDEHPEPVAQDETHVTYAHKLGARERALDPTLSPEAVERTVRALRPHIGARLALPDGSFLGVLASVVDGDTCAPAGGLVRTDGDRLLLDCNGGALELTEVKPAGGRPMSAREWLHGLRDHRLATFRLDPSLPGRPLEELVERARTEWADPGDEWQPNVCALAARGSADVLEAMQALGSEADPGARELAAYVLGQLGAGAATLPAEQAAALAALAAGESEPSVVAAIAYAFGHLGPPHGLGWLLAHRGDADGEVREAVAFALGGRDGADALAALIELSGDPEPEVRDWATFALGTLSEADTPPLRDALAARLDDDDESTRLEAVHGLVLRRDERATAPARALLAAAQGPPDSVWTRHLLSETAVHLGGLRPTRRGSPRGPRRQRQRARRRRARARRRPERRAPRRPGRGARARARRARAPERRARPGRAPGRPWAPRRARAPGRASVRPRQAAPGRASVRPRRAAPGRASVRPRRAAPGRASVRPRRAAPGRASARPRRAAPGRASARPGRASTSTPRACRRARSPRAAPRARGPGGSPGRAAWAPRRPAGPARGPPPPGAPGRRRAERRRRAPGRACPGTTGPVRRARGRGSRRQA